MGEWIEGGRVVVLLYLCYFGIYFSLVNFYYVYDSEKCWCYLLVEVSNILWNECYYYVVLV